MSCCLSLSGCPNAVAPSVERIRLSIEPKFSVGERFDVLVELSTRLTGGVSGDRRSEVSASIHVDEVDQDGRIIAADAVIRKATIAGTEARAGLAPSVKNSSEGNVRTIVPAGTSVEIRVSEGEVAVRVPTAELAPWEERFLAQIGDVFRVHLEPRPDRVFSLGEYGVGDQWEIDSPLYAERLRALGFSTRGALPQGRLRLVGSKTISGQECWRVEGGITSVDLEEVVGELSKKWNEVSDRIEWCAASEGRLVQYRNVWSAKIAASNSVGEIFEYTDRTEWNVTVTYEAR